MFSTVIKFFKNLFTQPDKCLECGKVFYTCETCGCAYDSASAAANCAEWDQILKHSCHHAHQHFDEMLPVSEEEQWLIDHPEERKLYVGKLVAVKAGLGIVAAGNDFDEVRNRLTRQGMTSSSTLFTKIPEE